MKFHDEFYSQPYPLPHFCKKSNKTGVFNKTLTLNLTLNLISFLLFLWVPIKEDDGGKEIYVSVRASFVGFFGLNKRVGTIFRRGEKSLPSTQSFCV